MIKIIFSLSIALGVLLSASTLSFAQTNPLQTACEQGDNTGNSGVCIEAQASTGGTNPITGEGGIANTVARLLALIVGIAAGIMLILGGLAFVTAGGNAEREAKARRRVIYGVIGLAVAVLAWTLISYIVSSLL